MEQQQQGEPSVQRAEPAAVAAEHATEREALTHLHAALATAAHFFETHHAATGADWMTRLAMGAAARSASDALDAVHDVYAAHVDRFVEVQFAVLPFQGPAEAGAALGPWLRAHLDALRAAVARGGRAEPAQLAGVEAEIAFLERP